MKEGQTALCSTCPATLVMVNGRWMHFETCMIGGGARRRPTVLYCPVSGQEGRPA